MIDAGGAKGEQRRLRGKYLKKYALGLIVLYFSSPPPANPPKPSVGNLTLGL
jgi:hypothetical protein